MKIMNPRKSFNEHANAGTVKAKHMKKVYMSEVPANPSTASTPPKPRIIPPTFTEAIEGFKEAWDNVFLDSSVSDRWRQADAMTIAQYVIHEMIIANAITTGGAPSNNTMATWMKLSNMLGMNPAARAKIPVEGAQRAEVNEFDDLMPGQVQ